MKILAKALCDQIHHDQKVSLLGVFQHITLSPGAASGALRGNLFISLVCGAEDSVKKTAKARVFLTDAKGKEVAEFFCKDVIEHVKKRGVNLLLDLAQTTGKPRKYKPGVYDVWMTMNDLEKEWITDVVVVGAKK